MKTVMIVDDGAFMRRMIRSVLEKHGYVVLSEAEDGIQAVDQYRLLRPDLVTMDITMPNMDGLEALKSIIKYDPDASVIMVSALGQEFYIRQSLMSGAVSFIVKPFDAEMLIQVIESI